MLIKTLRKDIQQVVTLIIKTIIKAYKNKKHDLTIYNYKKYYK